MSSKQTLLALYLFDVLNFIPYPIGWTHSSRTWTFQCNTSRLLPYYFLSLVYLGGAWLAFVLCVTIDLSLSPDAKVMSKDLLILHVLLIINIPFSFGMDFTLHSYGRDLVTFLNWIRLPSKPSNGVNYLAIIMFQIIISFTIFIGVIVPIAAVYLNLDPLMEILQMVAKPQILNLPWLASMSQHWSFLAFRYISAVIALQTLAINLRNVAVVGILALHALLTNVTRLMQRSAFSNTYYDYKETLTALGIVEEFARTSLAVYLTVVYFLIVVGTNVALLGMKNLNGLVLSISLFVVVNNFSVMMFLLERTCCLSEYSEKILATWQKRLWKSLRRRCARAVVRSLRRMAIKVGSTGTITREMKIGYLDSMLAQIINLLVLCKESSN